MKNLSIKNPSTTRWQYSLTSSYRALLHAPSPMAISRDLHLFGIMLGSALPLKNALENLARTSTSPALSSAYTAMLESVQRGASLQDAIAPFSHIFSPLGVALIRSGAHAGNLPEILEKLSSYFARLASNRASFLKALSYPVFVCISIVVAFVVIAIFVIPNFADLFASFDVELPFSTRSLLWVSWAITEFWWVWVAGLGAFVLLGALAFSRKGMFHHERISRAGFSLILRLPLFGRLLVYRDLWGYFLGFSYLYNARIEFDRAMPIALLSLQLPPVRDELTKASEQIEQGVALDVALGSCGYIDGVMRSFLATAQSSGELGEMLGLCANYCQSVYEQQIARLLALIEPLSTIAIALVVGWLAFGIFLPIWELGSINL